MRTAPHHCTGTTWTLRARTLSRTLGLCTHHYHGSATRHLAGSTFPSPPVLPMHCHYAHTHSMPKLPAHSAPFAHHWHGLRTTHLLPLPFPRQPLPMSNTHTHQFTTAHLRIDCALRPHCARCPHLQGSAPLPPQATPPIGSLTPHCHGLHTQLHTPHWY